MGRLWESKGSRAGDLGGQLWKLLQDHGPELHREAISLSVCLSPALLLNQGEWSFCPALTREGEVSEDGHGLKLPFWARLEAGWR